MSSLSLCTSKNSYKNFSNIALGTICITGLVLCIIVLIKDNALLVPGSMGVVVSGVGIVVFFKYHCGKKKDLEEGSFLYFSLTGNPAHPGHLSAVSTAIVALQTRGEKIAKVYISLSSQSYGQQKVDSDNAQSQKQNATKPPKVMLSWKQRQDLLNAVIDYSRKKGRFYGVHVEFYNDQKNGFSDHPESYQTLQTKHSSHRVYLIAGSDLCRKMENAGLWAKVHHAIIITRGNGDPQAKPVTNGQGEILQLQDDHGKVFVSRQSTSNFSRLILKNVFPEDEDYSSSDIQSGKAKFPTPKLQTMFEEARNTDKLYKAYLEKMNRTA